MNLLKKEFLKLRVFFYYATFFILILFISCSLTARQTWAQSNSNGEKLFIENCAGCHIKGGNIIRRNKTLKLQALKRNKLDNPEAIAKVAREGIGNMSGYKKVLGEEGDKIVANWIWEQAQKAWIQG